MKKLLLNNNNKNNKNNIIEDIYFEKKNLIKKSIIVVGNGPSVLKHEFGNIIDNFDEVVRINHYIPSKNVGKKLTIFAHSTYKTQFYEEVPLLAKEILVWNQINLKDFKSYETIKNTIIDREPIETLLKKHFNFNIFPQRPWCSTGIAILLHLINKYDKICIYGFDYLEKSKKLHYFETKIVNSAEHDSNLEKNFVDYFLKLGKLYKLEESNLVSTSA
jgi:hypothetical protein